MDYYYFNKYLKLYKDEFNLNKFIVDKYYNITFIFSIFFNNIIFDIKNFINIICIRMIKILSNFYK